jgi:nucleotide-binding universal stress UspA family protein
MTKNSFKKILVPIDGSISCLRARETAALIAAQFNSKITVVHVISHEFMHPELAANYQLPVFVRNKIDSVYTQAGEKILDAAVEALKDEGIEVEPILIKKSEDPADTILNLAKEKSFDLIVIGNRAETQAERFELGSTTEKIALYSKTPVLIVKRKTKIGKLLVAIDGSKQATKAFQYILPLAVKFNAEVTLLHAVETKLAKLEPEAIKKISENMLADVAKSAEGIIINKQIEYGSPSEVINRLVKQDNYDIVAVGSRGLSSVKRYLLGSVSEDVSMHAGRSVLIVK